jgi:hypothetical protein
VEARTEVADHARLYDDGNGWLDVHALDPVAVRADELREERALPL